MIKIRNLSVLAFAAMLGLAACGGDEAEVDGDVVSQDTAVVPGTEVIDQPTVVPTQDTVVQTTTTDTIQGDVNADTVAVVTP